jgi:mRNA-degrading endonuclease RelE of RelBE toxin-antitoxin system
MSYNVLQTTEFEKELKRLVAKYPSLKQEYGNLIHSLEENPAQGTALGKNCYKIRLAVASKGKGKSGGARVITCVFVADEVVVLVSIYDKSEQSTLSDDLIRERIKRFDK